MKRIIEVEEVVSIHHQIFVEYNNEKQLGDFLDDENNQIYDLDDFIVNLEKRGISVNEVNNNYLEETVSIEYFDDYAKE